jgi:hypothetical protein
MFSKISAKMAIVAFISVVCSISVVAAKDNDGCFAKGSDFQIKEIFVDGETQAFHDANNMGMYSYLFGAQRTSFCLAVTSVQDKEGFSNCLQDFQEIAESRKKVLHFADTNEDYIREVKSYMFKNGYTSKMTGNDLCKLQKKYTSAKNIKSLENKQESDLARNKMACTQQYKHLSDFGSAFKKITDECFVK